ncbi:LOW QUALITY PROTEIN: hypothetical protein M513_07253 [Trichuris suis]|uniref:Uncharacterized protein n=1 Tax=Trichuris suis TaxID=68888 RepID=A0A085M3X8_9BILA|nr:LOW QUALITY PROTEIN: hypothetical protein M513_07253 [Trichuris suis]
MLGKRAVRNPHYSKQGHRPLAGGVPHGRLLSPLDMMLPHAARAEFARFPFATQLRAFEVGDAVLARNFSALGPKWLGATVAGRQEKYATLLITVNAKQQRNRQRRCLKVAHVLKRQRSKQQREG